MKITLLVLITLLLFSCAVRPSKSNVSAWDFDHNLQFKQTKLSPKGYHLEIIPKEQTSFSQLATVLMRQSLLICQQYGFKLELLSGIEAFDQQKSEPNLIRGSLSANLYCAKIP